MNQKEIACMLACNECADACLQCTTASLINDDASQVLDCITKDMECANVCKVLSKSILQQDLRMLEICKVCAEICEICALACSKHNKKYYQKCAHACLHCAEKCRSLINENYKSAPNCIPDTIAI